ncbi:MULTISPECIES: Putative BamHI-like type II restriction endonuclease [Bacillus]|uniref:Putative BamHI-like type II restriction endonuclease n=1 Tax=Bacillus TaxID=1386 RepID=UPI0002A13B8E|nr:Putative BamHI-like type II restriction endonuclease [Bacillus subtilis]AGA21677.1 Putative BamHI-like type II restriction endonuclease [Bacillus subtilis subsp. subtilis str. BSP1]AMR45510.1 hypothetical protein KHRBS_02395 [Bacillus subtilis subsp. subtilis]MBG8577025.1 hypothetical protein [Bacillus subtilis]MBO3637929.1 hypothetical protein [Bacillus subtilis]MDP0483485.1 hypothetical protein [Bacillus subtilis]
MKIKQGIILIDKVDAKEKKEFIDPLREQVIDSILKLRWPDDADGFYFHPKSRTYTKDGKKVGGNGVKPIKEPFIENLKNLYGWKKEFPAFSSEERVFKIKVLKNFGKSGNLIYGRVVAIDRDNEKIIYTDRKGNKQEKLLYYDFESPLKDDELKNKIVSMTTAKPGALDACKKAGDKLFVVEWETGNISSSHRALNKMALLLLNGHISAGILIVPTRKMYPYLTDRIGNYDELLPYFNLWKNVDVDKGYLEIIPIEHDDLCELAPIIPKGTDGNAKKPEPAKTL